MVRRTNRLRIPTPKVDLFRQCERPSAIYVADFAQVGRETARWSASAGGVAGSTVQTVGGASVGSADAGTAGTVGAGVADVPQQAIATLLGGANSLGGAIVTFQI
jgi:hypothetical protein